MRCSGWGSSTASTRERAANALPPLSLEEEEKLSAESVDLIFEADHILIRPDPERMDLACAADELLQGLVSKRQVKFLSVADQRVREAIKHRGECWRLSAIPRTREAKERMVFGSKVGIHGLPIYFYNRLTGTRWLTCQEFENLGKLDDASLARHLQEIADHAILRNRLGRPEVDFFAADLRRFGARQFAGVVYEQLPPEQLRAKFEELRDHFRSAVHEAFRTDDCHNKAWCERILSTLFLEGNEAQTEQILSGLSPEFFMQVEWLPGGRFEEGEFLFDSIFDEAAEPPRGRGVAAAVRPAGQRHHLQSHPRVRRPRIRQRGLRAGVVVARPAAEAGPARRLPGGIPFPQRARHHQALHAPPEMGRLGAPGRRQGPAAIHQGERRLHRLLPGSAAGLPPVRDEPHPPGGHAPAERDL